MTAELIPETAPASNTAAPEKAGDKQEKTAPEKTARKEIPAGNEKDKPKRAPAVNKPPAVTQGGTKKGAVKERKT
jgi:hypothetical protein